MDPFKRGPRLLKVDINLCKPADRAVHQKYGCHKREEVTNCYRIVNNQAPAIPQDRGDAYATNGLHQKRGCFSYPGCAHVFAVEFPCYFFKAFRFFFLSAEGLQYFYPGEALIKELSDMGDFFLRSPAYQSDSLTEATDGIKCRRECEDR